MRWELKDSETSGAEAPLFCWTDVAVETATHKPRRGDFADMGRSVLRPYMFYGASVAGWASRES